MKKKPGNFVRFLGYVKPYWKIVLLGAIGGVVKFTVPLLTPQITRYLLDHVLLNAAMTLEQKTHQLFYYVGGMMAIYLIFWTPWTYVRHYYTQKAGQKSVFDLRCDLYEHILRMSASFFDRNRSGSIVSRMISDISLAQNLVGSALTNVWMDGISLVVILVMLFRIDAASTFVALATFPFYVVVIKVLGGKLRKTTLAVQDKISNISGTLQEKIAGNVIVQAFTQEKKEELDFLQESNQLFSMTMHQGTLQSLNVTLNGLLVSIAPLIVTIFCGYRVILGHLTVGDMVAISLYLGPLYLPIQRFTELNVIFSNSMAALDRIFGIMDEVPEIHDQPGALSLKTIRGKVEFRGVHFAYPNAPEDEQGPVLKDVTFTVEPGQKVALVGPSGAGKSTVVGLIPRFYDVLAGEILVDDLRLREIELKSLRHQVGMVMQDAILFSGTIEDNLRYGNPQASLEQVKAACRAANAYDFILQQPNGFQTEVGEGGNFLSGGQKQRLTIARAFLRDPKILILDEATAALDAESEHLVKDALQQLMVGRTTVIIAHRLSTVVNADCILVMDNGQIVERGTHSELLRKQGLYYRLYAQQFESAGVSFDLIRQN